MIYTNPHNGNVMIAVYVNPDKLRDWHGDWIPDLIDYSKPLGVIGYNPLCNCVKYNEGTCDILTCKYARLNYSLIQHELYTDGVIIECPVRFTTKA
jgi:hypothetical protein